MARRAPEGEKPFRPLDASVLHSVMQHTPVVKETAVQAAAEAPPRVMPLSVLGGNEPRHQETHDPKPLMLIHEVQRRDQEKRILFTLDETQALDRLVSNLAVRLRTQVKASHVFRALASLLLHAENQIDQRAGELGGLTRPPNGDLAALHRFERDIASLLAHAMRDAGAPR